MVHSGMIYQSLLKDTDRSFCMVLYKLPINLGTTEYLVLFCIIYIYIYTGLASEYGKTKKATCAG